MSCDRCPICPMTLTVYSHIRYTTCIHALLAPGHSWCSPCKLHYVPCPPQGTPGAIHVSCTLCPVRPGALPVYSMQVAVCALSAPGHSLCTPCKLHNVPCLPQGTPSEVYISCTVCPVRPRALLVSSTSNAMCALSALVHTTCTEYLKESLPCPPLICK